MSTIRLSGMASGLDTDSIVEQLMKVEKEKYYKVERQLYKTEYQMEAYRGVTTKLQEFKSSYLDILGTSNMTSSSTYRKFKTDISDATGNASKAVSITSTSGANAGKHTLEISQVASKAIVQGVKATGNLRTGEITELNLEGKSIDFTVDGKTRKIDLANNVIFAGKKPYDQISKFYKLGDVFVNASTTETQGLTFIEAMASRIPVVAKYDKNLVNVIKDNETGCLFKSNDEYANKVIKILNDKNYKNNIIQNAYEIANEYSVENFVNKIEIAYQSVLKVK